MSGRSLAIRFCGTAHRATPDNGGCPVCRCADALQCLSIIYGYDGFHVRPELVEGPSVHGSTGSPIEVREVCRCERGVGVGASR